METVHSVSQVNRYIKNLFARDYALQRILVRGEISNCKYHSSGHVYFTIKDKTAQLSCVMFASYVGRMSFRMQEGQSVVVQGNISVYERDGKYQMYAEKVTQEGTGRLYEEYEKLKKRLRAEGLFEESRKKIIPRYALKIGIVTAQTGAVIQDICQVAKRRNPYVQLILYPAQVQGEGAAQTIIRGLQYFEKTDVDTVIIGRGGGSIEDLWAFNEEALAYAIADYTKPVISAVGHETDTTIADYAADLRAPTPSAAAELAVFSWDKFEESMTEYGYAFKRRMKNILELSRIRTRHYKAVLDSYSPQDLLKQRRLLLAEQLERLQNVMQQCLTASKHRLALCAQRLDGLSPLQKLKSGYSYVADADGANVRSATSLQVGQTIRLTMADGSVDAEVLEIDEGNGGELWRKN